MIERKISKCGSGLHIYIPVLFAEAMKINDGSIVDLTIEGTTLIITPLKPA